MVDIRHIKNSCRGNKLDVAADSVSLLQSPDLSTAPFTMLADTDVSYLYNDTMLAIP